MDAELTGSAAAPSWKGLPRRHPCAHTADRIRDHIARYGSALGDGHEAALHTAAAVLELIAHKEPNR